MNSKNNRVNHDFQILYFLAGSCHTPDGAYALLCDLREERSDALKQVAVSTLRIEAKTKKAQRVLAAPGADEIDVLLAKADLVEIEAGRETAELCIAGAQAELAFIEGCMKALDQHRKFRDLPLSQAHEAVQREEWRLELIRRAENFLLMQGTIPADEFNTMRSHPDFDNLIYPELVRIGDEMKNKNKSYVPIKSAVLMLLPSPIGKE